MKNLHLVGALAFAWLCLVFAAAVPARAQTERAVSGNSLAFVKCVDTGTSGDLVCRLEVLAGGFTAVAGATFTRPGDTTAYASGDLVANSTTAGSVTPMSVSVARYAGATGMIRRVRLAKSNTSTTNASFRVHFYKDLPTVTNGDNGAWLSTQSTYLGAADITMDKVFSDGAKGIGVPNTGTEIAFDTNAGVTTLYALIEARAAYTPVSAEVFTLAVEVLRD